MKKRLCCLCFCAPSLSVLVTVLATNYNYDSTTIPYYEEILEEEPITQALTGDDVPESIISYSDTGGLRVQIPSELTKQIISPRWNQTFHLFIR